MSPKIQLNINATSLRYAHCLLSWYRVIHEGWVEPRFNSKIVYGMAVHKYLEVCYRTGDKNKAMDEAQQVFRQDKISDRKAQHLEDEGHLAVTCFQAWQYAVADKTFDILKRPDGLPAVEQTFSIPFYEDDIIVVNVCGTLDKLGKIRNGCFAVGDWKTTSAYDPKSYLDSYRLSHQLRFYILSLKLAGRYFTDTTLGEIGNTRVGAFIDGVFLKDKLSEQKIIRSETFLYSDDDIFSFEKALVRRIKQLSSAIADGSVYLREGIMNSTCELKYNKCLFAPVCAVGNKDIEQILLERNFVKRPYDPLNRDKGV